MTAGWKATALHLVTDEAHGGRWTSLRTDRREWLWTNPEPTVREERQRVVSGQPFVDAGGAEECIPTVRGLPDHGDAWSRRWDAAPAAVAIPGVGRLTRTVAQDATGILVSYRLTGAPGVGFLHAVHALLDVGPTARVVVASRRSCVVLDPEPHEVAWTSGIDRLGPDDGTATCALLRDCDHAWIEDGDEALELSWRVSSPTAPCSLLLWRNLRGWPQPVPYRSIGVEPMVGAAAELSTAARDDVAHLGAEGTFEWQLRLTALTLS